MFKDKKGQEYGGLIFILILVGGWLLINNIYVVIEETNAPSDYKCENGNIKNTAPTSFGINFAETEASLRCLVYPQSRWKVYCDENNISKLQCKVTIYQKYFATQKSYFP